MIRVPPYLRKGDTVGLICPAGFMKAEKTLLLQEQLTAWGYKIKTGKTIGHQYHYFSGTDTERLLDLQAMLDDKDIRAIICARGGYGTSRIIDQIDWKQFKKNPKWIAGYSDVTVLLCHIFQKIKTASLHAPMAGAFADAGGEDEFNITLNHALSGKRLRYQSQPHPCNSFGKTSGRLLGGNLSLLAHLIGTSSFPDTSGAIIFLEDIGEYLYHIDRMLIQLERSGKLKQISGILIGSFSELKDTVIPFGRTVEEIIQERLSKYDIPVAWQFPVGHVKENVALRVGMLHTLVVNRDGGTLTCTP